MLVHHKCVGRGWEKAKSYNSSSFPLSVLKVSFQESPEDQHKQRCKRTSLRAGICSSFPPKWDTVNLPGVLSTAR